MTQQDHTTFRFSFTPGRTLLAAMALMLSAGACKTRIPLSPEPPSWLEEEVNKLGQRMSPGSEREGDLYQEASVQEGKGVRFGLPLNKGKCYALAAVGDRNIQRMSLYLWDPEGDRAETKRGGSSKTVLTHCPEMSGLFEMEVKTTEGNGHFAVGAFASDAPEPEPAEQPDPEPAAPDLSALVDKEAKSAAAGSERVGDFYIDSSKKREWFTALDAGHCYWLVGVGEPGEIDELSLYLWDKNDDRVTQSKSRSNAVTLGHCPKRSGMFRFEAAIGSGSGTYYVGLYKKKK